MATQILLTVDEQGQFGMQVAGDAGSKVVLLGILELAKSVILNPPADAQPKPILLANGSLPKARDDANPWSMSR